jgi:CBS domain-containing protein
MKIREIMNQPAVTCRPEDSLNTAAQLMWDHDIGAVQVVGDDGDLLGIITDRDICMAAFTRGAPLQDMEVGSAMARDVFSCQASDSLQTAEQLMGERQVRRVPVLDGDNRPIGMVTLNDLARQAAAARKRNGLDREVTQTLAAICQPRAEIQERIITESRSIA